MRTLTRAENQSIFSKPPRLIEKAATEPIRVMQEVFRCVYLDDLRDDLLPKWLNIAISNEYGIYAEERHRTTLLNFYDQVLILIEALQVFSEQQSESESLDHSEEAQKLLLLTSEQIANPLQIITGFQQKFSLNYVRRELWYFLESAVTYGGDYPTGFTPGHALMAYAYLSCLTDSVYNLGD